MPENIKPSAAISGLVIENDVDNCDCVISAKMWMHKKIKYFSQWNEIYMKGLLMKTPALYNFVAIEVKKIEFLSAIFKSHGIIGPEYLPQ